LTRLGLVKATRGRGGGLRLAEGASERTIGGLLRRFEPDFAAQQCLGAARKGCVIFSCCGLRGVFNESQRALFAVLDKYTLADVLNRSAGAPAKLGLPSAA
ncbi:MAG: Rrf2 family transcriptional regulator, partial [Methylocystis sp.]|nr:Rrf2 family transcriptional regulator [Methylocystis sp.]